MATPWTTAQRIAAYRREGITKIVELPGWRTHNRDDETGRPFGPVYGAVIHHTAGVGKGMTDLVRSGTGDLPGPLCHDYLAKDGTLYLVGHGRTNHAGSVTPAVRAAIIAEQAPATQRSTGAETVDGNDFLYGLEIENRGDGKDPYPPAQYDVALRWAVAHCRHFNWGHNSVWGHKEITRRKIDPSFSMNLFRDDVHRRLTRPVPPVVKPTPAPATNGSSPMDGYTSLARTVSQSIPAGESRKIYWTSEYQDGPADHGAGGYTVLAGNHYTGTLSLTFAAGIPVGVSVRGLQELTPGNASGEPVTDLTAGPDEHSVSVTGRVPLDRQLYFEITNASAVPVELVWAGLRLGSWAL